MKGMDYKCIIFDCDGVLVDSEGISAGIFQEMASELGFQMDYDTAVEKFAGASMNDNLQFLADNVRGKLPDSFEEEFRERTYQAFKTSLKPVPGIHAFLGMIKVPVCVASSGPIEKIRLNLITTGLIDNFEGNIFSCYDIKSWKPEPGIYLYAARKMGFSPHECLVIEDSLAGIKAAVAGGFTVFALSNDKNREKFEKQGARVFNNHQEIGHYLNLE